MVLGMTVGIVIGAATDNVGTWLAIGLALGAALGAASRGGSRSGGSDAPSVDCVNGQSNLPHLRSSRIPPPLVDDNDEASAGGTFHGRR